MAASDYVPIFFKNRLHLAGRPQMSSRPNKDDPHIGWTLSLPRDAAEKGLTLLLDIPTCKFVELKPAASRTGASADKTAKEAADVPSSGFSRRSAPKGGRCRGEARRSDERQQGGESHHRREGWPGRRCHSPRRRAELIRLAESSGVSRGNASAVSGRHSAIRRAKSGWGQSGLRAPAETDSPR